MRAGRVEQTGSPEEVFEHPANAFVMDFLGHVNVFHGRVQNGRAVLGSVEVACPEYADQEARPVMVYVRPHELDIDRSADTRSSLKAKILHINPTGSVTRVQLHAPEFDREIHVDVSPSRYAELSLKPGDVVYVWPRRIRVFMPDYVI
jgi:sulfate transport system ATP-binding protein